MGLILAGAGMGLGAGMQQVGKDWSAQNLEKMREDAATARQNALIEANKFLESSRQGHAEKMAIDADERKKAPSIAAGKAMSGLINASPPDRVISGDSPEGNIGDVTISGKPSNKETTAVAIQAYLDAGGDAAGVSALRDMFKKEHITQAEGAKVVDADGNVISEATPKTAVPEAPGQAELRAAQAKLAEAQADYYKGAKANEAQARADRLAAGKEQKPVGPNIKPFKGESGEYLVDLNSGAVGVVIPGTDAKDAVWHLFSKNEPAKPATLAKTIWSTADGQPLPGGPFSLYKQLPVNYMEGNAQPTGANPPQRIDPALFDPNAKNKLAPTAGGTINPPATETPLQTAERLATERGNAVDAESERVAYTRARQAITADIEALISGSLDTKSQENYRRLFRLSTSPAISGSEKSKVLQLLKKY